MSARRGLAVALFAVFFPTCAGRERIRPPESPAPSLASPSDAIPAELDVALRIDLGRIRSLLGQSTLGELSKRGLTAGSSGDAEAERWLTEVMAEADSVWIALRPGPRAELTDSVTILRGRFARFDPHQQDPKSRWQPGIDLGGGWRRYDRGAPGSRAAPARIYARADDVLVLVSPASLDSVERQLELRARDPHLEPAGKGVMSLEARGRVLHDALADRAPSTALLLGRARRLSATVDLDSVGLRAELDLELESDADARQAADALGPVAKSAAEQGGIAAQVTSGLRIEAVGAHVVAHLALPPETVAALLGCAAGPSCD